MLQAISEDELYRTSTQYRYWSFSSDELAERRSATHSAAVNRAYQYLDPDDTHGTSNGGDTHMSSEGEPDDLRLLTLAEESRLVQRYCEQLRTTSDFFKWPVNVKATAVQYLKRFYLTNSAMTYPPKEIYKSVLFLASKTEGVHMTLGEYARRIKTAPEDVLAPEYKIVQALRFTLDVRQPFRGLRGALMDLLDLMEGPGSTAEIKAGFASLPAPDVGASPQGYASNWRPGRGVPMTDRAQAAYTAARVTLDAPALLTDVYFLFTPPQVHLAALRLADAPLTDYYLSLKLSGSDAMTGELAAAVRRVVDQCAGMLAAHAEDPVMSKDERAALEERLELCRDPATKDLVGAHAKAKIGGADADEVRMAKADRQREKAQSDDIFGPSIGK